MYKTLLWAFLLVGGLCLMAGYARLEEPAEADAEPESYTKRYSLYGIPVYDDEWVEPDVVRPRARILIPNVPDSGPAIIYPTPKWHGAASNHVADPMAAGTLADQINTVAQVDFWDNPEADAVGLTFTGDANEHAVVAWILEQLRAYYAQRVRFVVFELPAPQPNGPVAAPRVAQLKAGASLTGTRSANPGEIALVSTLRSFDYTACYQISTATSAVIPAPELHRMHVGNELALSACPGPDGSLMVRCVRGSTKLHAMATFDGPEESGVFELPDFDYGYEEGGALLEKGEGLVFADRYLVTATLESPYQTAWCPERPLALLSPTLLVRRESFALDLVPGITHQPFLFSETTNDVDEAVARGGPADITYMPDTYLQPQLLEYFAASGAEVLRVGPLVCLRWDEAAPPRDSVVAPAPQSVAFHVRRWTVSKSAQMHESLLAGNPTAEALRLLGEPQHSARVYQFEHGVIENSQLRLSNYVASLETNTATGVAVYEPRVGTMVTGTRLSINVGTVEGAGVEVSVLYGFAPPGEIQTSQAKTKYRGVVQTATVSATALRFAGTLKVGDSISEITPAPGIEDKVVVLVITRVEP